MKSLRPAAGALLTMAQWLLLFGSDKGAMLVEAQGVDEAGRAVAATWRLNADANRGPYVPVLAAVALVRKARDGAGAAPGARTAAGLLTIDEFAADFDATCDHILQAHIDVRIGYRHELGAGADVQGLPDDAGKVARPIDSH